MVANSTSDRKIYLSKYGKESLASINYFPRKTDYGYSLTQIILNSILNISHPDAVPDFFREKCTHVLVTNSDNLYSEQLFTFVTKEIKNGMEVIAWDSVTHHTGFGRRNPRFFGAGEMDLGAGIVSIKLLKKIRHHFVNFDEQAHDASYYHGCDGLYWERVFEESTKAVIIPQILLLHQ